MANKIMRWVRTFNYPSYFVFFVTARCNARCKMCFYAGNMEKSEGKARELTVEEYDKISRGIRVINILGISGGEPFIREDLSEVVKVLYRNCRPLVVDLPTNGWFTESIVRQVEDIARNCPEMMVDLQLSIDGPEAVHDEIRGLKGCFRKVGETYRQLVPLKQKYPNLRLKSCVVYSAYNQHVIEELFGILEKDFPELDRGVFSVAHGSVSNPQVMDFDWDKYFKLCDRIAEQAAVKRLGDFHSVFTLALRLVKNRELKRVLKDKDFYRYCKAGKRVVAVGETGNVYPCEPLWESVGNLRENGYDMGAILRSEAMRAFQEKIIRNRCTCHWGLPISNGLLYRVSRYPVLLGEMIGIWRRTLSRHRPG